MICFRTQSPSSAKSETHRHMPFNEHRLKKMFKFHGVPTLVFEGESWGSRSPDCSTFPHHFFTTVNTTCEGYCFE